MSKSKELLLLIDEAKRSKKARKVDKKLAQMLVDELRTVKPYANATYDEKTGLFDLTPSFSPMDFEKASSLLRMNKQPSAALQQAMLDFETSKPEPKPRKPRRVSGKISPDELPKSERKYPLEWFKKNKPEEVSEEILQDVIDYYSTGNIQKAYYSSNDYMEIYPYFQKFIERSKKKRMELADKAMAEVGVKYGDTVGWALIGAFMSSTWVEGILTKRKDGPIVKLTKGAAEVGKKTVKWHRGFKKVS